MPELPEVEVVRLGLERGVAGRTVRAVDVHHDRAVRRHEAGARDFVDLLRGRTVVAARRRGKYLWLPLDSGDALTGHLGMSGQLLVVPADKPLETHLRIRFSFTDGGRELRFVDQRTFGGLQVVAGGADLPSTIAHIARDPLDPEFDDELFVARLRKKVSGVKRALLDQTLVSGIGNIYADEALWAARIHYAQPSNTLSRAKVRTLLAEIRHVLSKALAEGGTSFDAQYVNVNGNSGYFSHSLNAYGQQGKQCPRCGTPIVREQFMNRGSHFCPHCQRLRLRLGG